jgi:hypothetical protein
MDPPVPTKCSFPNNNEAFTKFQVSTICHLGGEESASYFKPFTPLGSTMTQRKIIAFSCPDNMHIY